MEVLAKLGFDWKVALANLVNFLIIYYLLRNVVFKKIGNAIKERREKIQAGLEDAEKAKQALVVADKEKEKIITDGYKQVEEMLVLAEDKKKSIINSAKGEAEEEAQKIKESSRKEIEILAEKQSKEIKQKAVDLIISGMEKVLKENIDEKKSEKLIKNLVG
ncbi:MAG: F0F1 ATP synthase subunit B [Bacteroidetes bacterium]|nr:F0F1 ATP synthase subunit B [Bacteroidota bacterium]